MDPQNAIETFARSVASFEKSELEDIIRHITEFYDELAALPQIEFFAIHIRHPFLNNSRSSLAIPMPSALKRTQTVLGQVLGGTKIDKSLAFDFHASLLDIYFKLIGRSDSFSDSILRAAGYPDETSSRELLATFAFVGSTEQGISYQEEPSFLAVTADRGIRCRLLGWDGDGSTTPSDLDCKLLSLFFTVVFKEIYEHGAAAETLIERARQVLERECFFTSREAFISSESAKLVRSAKPALVKSRAAAERMFTRLFKGGVADPAPSDNSHNEQVSRVAQILAMFQSVGIYTPVSSDEFAVYAFKLEDGSNPFAHGITLGGKHLDRDFLQQRRRGAQVLIQNINDKLVHQCKERTGARRKCPLQQEVTFEDDEQQETLLQRQLSLGGLNWDAFDCLTYVANHLLGERHENNPLSFRIVTATDETLRQYFEPITAESGILNKNEKRHVEVVLSPEEPQTVWNALLRVIAIIEGNYSFAQDESLYLCFSYAPQAWTLRYLARFHRRIRRQLDNVGKRPVSRVEQLEIISGLSRGALFAFLENNDTGLIALNGELLALGNKRSTRRWQLASRKDELRDKLTKVIEPAFSNNPAVKGFLPTLYEVIKQIADSPGKGATFVIGKWRGKGNLETRCQKMTAVFEMARQWQLSEVDDVILYQAAIQDGAIVIGTDTNELYCRRQLVAVDDKGIPFNPERWPLKKPLVEQWNDENSQYSWPTSGNWYKWGTRHRSAASLAYVGRGRFIVVCVSSDTAVHVFNGKLVDNLRG